MRIEGLDDELVRRVLARLNELEPEAVAVVVRGSYARGRPQLTSDLDISAIVARRTTAAEYRTWFEPRPGTWPLHVSAGTHTVEEWLAYRQRPAGWMTLGFPACTVASYVWATDEARRILGDPPSNRHLLATGSLEDMVESISKLRRAQAAGDTIALRWRAHTAAREVPALLRDLNEPRLVHDSTEALKAALALEVVPQHYTHDFPRAFGLSSADDDAVAAAALRLARELFAFLRERNPEVDPQPGVADALRDGTFERHLGFTTA